VITERTVGAALRGRPAWNSVLGRQALLARLSFAPNGWSVCREIEFHAGRPQRAAPTVRSASLHVPTLR